MANLIQHDKNVIEAHFAKLGRMGGKKGGPARSRALTPKRRHEIARQASRVRWAATRKQTKQTTAD